MKILYYACCLLFLFSFSTETAASLGNLEIIDLKEDILWDEGEDYDPLAARHMQRITFSIRNNGASTSTFFISVSNGHAASLNSNRYTLGSAKGERLTYHIFSTSVPDPVHEIKSRRDLLNKDNVIPIVDLRPGETRDETLFISIDPQQLVIDDSYYDAMAIELVSGTYLQPGALISSHPLRLSTVVKKVVSLQINSGENKWNLGELTPGKVSLFDFMVFSNDTYAINLDTKNSFKLQHETSDSFSIPYTLTIQPKRNPSHRKTPYSATRNQRTTHEGSPYQMKLVLPDTTFPNGTYSDTLYITLKNN